jgi:hypothetical protein
MEDQSQPTSQAQLGPPGTATATPPKDLPEYLRVIVDGTDKEGKPIHVNLRLPIKLLNLGIRLGRFIPPGAQQHMKEELRRKGMDVDLSQIKPEDLQELIENFEDVSIDVEHSEDNVKVKIYAE